MRARSFPAPSATQRRGSGAAALLVALGLGACLKPAGSTGSTGATSTAGESKGSTSQASSSGGASTGASASSGTGEVPGACPEDELYRCRLDAEGECGPGSGCVNADACNPWLCDASDLWPKCEGACGFGWECTPSPDDAILLCRAETPSDCLEDDLFLCRLDAEGACGPGSGCVADGSCDPLDCVGSENSDSWGACESLCGFGWDCSQSADPSVLHCTADPVDEGCDLWEQDCPAGYKCAAWADDGGGSWNATRCVPVVPRPKQVGEPCSFPGSVLEGDDDCDLGLMCWSVDSETGTGTCTGYCGGSPDEPTCAEGSVCIYVNRGVGVALCLDICDPLAQDCPGQDLCLPSGDEWLCTLDASGDGGQFGDPCEFLNACDKGLACVIGDFVPGCEASGCCSPMCDLNAPNTCPGVGQVCLPWYEEGEAPPGYEHLGVCGLPL